MQTQVDKSVPTERKNLKNNSFALTTEVTAVQRTNLPLG